MIRLLLVGLLQVPLTDLAAQEAPLIQPGIVTAAFPQQGGSILSFVPKTACVWGGESQNEMCVEGASWVQREILHKNPSADLEVYAVWLPILNGDAARGPRPDLIPDTRVTHYWDPEKSIGEWFGNLQGSERVAWDVFFLYGGEATWTEKPGPLLEWGYPVIRQTEKLMKAIGPLLSSS